MVAAILAAAPASKHGGKQGWQWCQSFSVAAGAGEGGGTLPNPPADAELCHRRFMTAEQEQWIYAAYTL